MHAGGIGPGRRGQPAGHQVVLAVLGAAAGLLIVLAYLGHWITESTLFLLILGVILYMRRRPGWIFSVGSYLIHDLMQELGKGSLWGDEPKKRK